MPNLVVDRFRQKYPDQSVGLSDTEVAQFIHSRTSKYDGLLSDLLLPAASGSADAGGVPEAGGTVGNTIGGARAAAGAASRSFWEHPLNQPIVPAWEDLNDFQRGFQMGVPGLGNPFMYEIGRWQTTPIDLGIGAATLGSGTAARTALNLPKAVVNALRAVEGAGTLAYGAAGAGQAVDPNASLPLKIAGGITGGAGLGFGTHNLAKLLGELGGTVVPRPKPTVPPSTAIPQEVMQQLEWEKLRQNPTSWNPDVDASAFQPPLSDLVGQPRMGGPVPRGQSGVNADVVTRPLRVDDTGRIIQPATTPPTAPFKRTTPYGLDLVDAPRVIGTEPAQPPPLTALLRDSREGLSPTRPGQPVAGEPTTFLQELFDDAKRSLDPRRPAPDQPRLPQQQVGAAISDLDRGNWPQFERAGSLEVGRLRRVRTSIDAARNGPAENLLATERAATANAAIAGGLLEGDAESVIRALDLPKNASDARKTFERLFSSDEGFLDSEFGKNVMSSLVGATGGSLAGAAADDEFPLRGAILGAAAGGVGGYAFPLVVKRLGGVNRSITNLEDLDNILGKEYVKRRFPAQDLSRRAATAREVLGAVYTSTKALVSFEWDIRRIGKPMNVAVDHITTYMKRASGLPLAIQNDLAQVVDPLVKAGGGPQDYTAFSWYLNLLRDKDVYMSQVAENVRRRAKGLDALPIKLQGKSTGDELLQKIAQMEQGFRPEIRGAIMESVENHRALMRTQLDWLTTNGYLPKDFMEGHYNETYFPTLVTHYLKLDPAASGAVSMKPTPLRPGNTGFLKRRLGTEQEALHDYLDVAERYLGRVKSLQLRHQLAHDLLNDYNIVGRADRRIPDLEYSTWSFRGGDLTGQAAQIPTVLKERLDKYYNPPGFVLRQLNRGSNWWKGLTLRAAMFSFDAINGLSDSFNLFAHEATNKPEHIVTLPIRFVESMIGSAGLVAKQHGYTAGQGIETLATSAAGSVAGGLSSMTLPDEYADRFGGRLATTLMGVIAGGAFGSSKGFKKLAHKVPGIRSVLDAMHSGDSQHLNRLVTIAEEADRLGLGTAAAVADVAPTAATRQLRRGGIVGAASKAAHMQDVFRSWRENVGRLAMYMGELERGSSPKRAAAVTSYNMVDYVTMTPFENQLLRGLFAPFWTWMKKNQELWTPGLRKQIDADGRIVDGFVSRGVGAVEAAGRAGVIGLVTYGAFEWNDRVAPEKERDLDPYFRDMFHLWLPVGWDDSSGKFKYEYFGFPDPSHIAGKALGFGGIVRVAKDVMNGAKPPDELWQPWEAGKQWFGLANPLVGVGFAALGDRYFPDVEMRINREDDSGTFRAYQRQAKQAISALLLPASRVGRSFQAPPTDTDYDVRQERARERLSRPDPKSKLHGAVLAINDVVADVAQKTKESSGRLASSVLVGRGLVRDFDAGELEAQAMNRRVKAGENKAAREYRAVVRGLADPLVSYLMDTRPNAALSVLIQSTNAIERSGGDAATRGLQLSVIRAALQMAAQDREDYREVYRRYELWADRHYSRRQIPFIAEELNRLNPEANKQR